MPLDSARGKSAATVGKRHIAVKPEALSEEVMPSRLCGQPPTVLDRLTSSLDGVNDSRIASAPAQMTIERLADGARIVAFAVLDERRCPDGAPRPIDGIRLPVVQPDPCLHGRRER